MKSTITKITLSLLTVLFFVLSNTTTAQTTFNVSVNAGSFTNATISINVGDSVKWSNSSGFHNVNGTTTTFPSNPESFGNALGSSWVFIYGFTIAGTYAYQCDQHVLGGMVGAITVVDPNSIDDNSLSSGISTVYPVPAAEYVSIDFSQELLSPNVPLTVVIYDIMGREVLRIENIADASLKLNTNGWDSPMYVYHIISGAEIIEMGKILVQ